MFIYKKILKMCYTKFVESSENMTEWTITYTISQVLTVFVYLFLCLTYFLKKRSLILNINVLAHITQAVAFFLLNGLTGVMMNILYIIRDSILSIGTKKRKSNKAEKRDVIELIVFFILIIISAILTYNGPKSLFSVFATIIATIAIWQKSSKIYKLLGIPISILWLLYNIALKSIFGIILESILLVSIIIGYLIDLKKQKKTT